MKNAWINSGHFWFYTKSKFPFLKLLYGNIFCNSLSVSVIASLTGNLNEVNRLATKTCFGLSDLKRKATQ